MRQATTRQARVFAGLMLVFAAALSAAGCWTGGLAQVAGTDSLSADLTAESTPRLARLQRAEPPGPPPVSAPPPPISGTQQTSLTSGKNVRVSVRAWVNGRPIFDDEVLQMISPSSWQQLQQVSEPQRSERLSDIYNHALDQIIEQEVAYQEAVRKLQKSSPRALDKLKTIVGEDFEKQMKRIRDSGKANEDQIKELEHTMRRQLERSMISTEYMRSRIFPYIQSRIGPEEIKEYYDTHSNEFTRLDSVKWQDIFIAVSPKLPTVAHAKRFAEDLVKSCKTVEDFNKLVQYDDGDSKFRGGEGLGSRRGEIKPPELENVLFQLREGQVGPVIELSTGVHIVRVMKREVAGQIPLDEKAQNAIRGKLRSQLADREYKRIVRELRARATIEIEREGS